MCGEVAGSAGRLRRAACVSANRGASPGGHIGGSRMKGSPVHRYGLIPMWKLPKTPRSVNAIVIGAAVVEALDSGMRRGC